MEPTKKNTDAGVSGMTAGFTIDDPVPVYEHSGVMSLGKNSLQQVYDCYHNCLFANFLPHMEQHIIDHEYGGFMCNADIETGKLISDNKQTWFEGRGIWVYSFLYNHFGNDPQYLEIARKSKDFIMKNRPADGNLWLSMFTREGNPAAGTETQYGNQFAVPTSAQGDIYGNLFIAEGLIEYSRASGEEEHWLIARKIIFDAVNRYDQADYMYHVNYLDPDIKNASGSRVLGHWMILLRTATQILSWREDADIKRLADRCIDAIMNHHLNPEYQLFNEVLNHDFSRPTDEFGTFCYIGHGIETLWMVMDEAARRKDTDLLKKACKAFKRHVSVARDDVYGGYFRSLGHVENNHWKVDKVLWLHEEILIGALFLIEHTGDAWAKQLFEETFDYVLEKFTPPNYLFWIPGGDRKLADYQKGRVENYHHPRHLMLNLLALNRIMERKGKPTGIFDP